MSETDVIPALIAPQILEEEINIKHKINTQLQIVVWATQEKNRVERVCVTANGASLRFLREGT